MAFSKDGTIASSALRAELAAGAGRALAVSACSIRRSLEPSVDDTSLIDKISVIT